MASTVGESTWMGPVIALLCVVGVLGTALWVFGYYLRYVRACCGVCCRVLRLGVMFFEMSCEASSWNGHANPI